MIFYCSCIFSLSDDEKFYKLVFAILIIFITEGRIVAVRVMVLVPLVRSLLGLDQKAAILVVTALIQSQKKHKMISLTRQPGQILRSRVLQ